MALATQQRKSLGEVISDLVRQGLLSEPAPPTYRNGIRLMPVGPGATSTTLEQVNRLRDELP